MTLSPKHKERDYRGGGGQIVFKNYYIYIYLKTITLIGTQRKKRFKGNVCLKYSQPSAAGPSLVTSSFNRILTSSYHFLKLLFIMPLDQIRRSSIQHNKPRYHGAFPVIQWILA